MATLDPKDISKLLSDLKESPAAMQKFAEQVDKLGMSLGHSAVSAKNLSKTGSGILKQIQSREKQLSRLRNIESLGIKSEKEKLKIIKKAFADNAKEFNYHKKLLGLKKHEIRLEKRLAVEGIKEDKKRYRYKIAQERKTLQETKRIGKKFGYYGPESIAIKKKYVERGAGVTTGNIASDVDDALDSIFKPFQNKSLNPLKWLKGGSDAAGEMEKSSKKMSEWSEALKKGTFTRRMAAGKEVIRRRKEVGVGGGGKEVAKRRREAGVDAIGTGRISGIKSTIVGAGVRGSGGGRGAGARAGHIKNLTAFNTATKGLQSMITVVQALSTALGVLSKMSWIFAIIGAISAIVSKGIELDKFLKGLNKTFMEMAGATLGMNVGKQMRSFNDAIFDLNRNLTLGIKPEDTQKMFQAIAGAGMAPQVLAGKAGGFDKVIMGVRKTNIDLGVSFEDSGKMISEQMMNLQGSFEDTRSSLESLGFNAMKAGVNTNKFYAAIENSISSLSYFGNFTKVASERLTTFIKQGTLGFKDATDAASSYMQVFQKMGWKDLQKVFAMAGGPMGGGNVEQNPIVKMMRNTNKEFMAELETKKTKKFEIETKLKGGATDPELIKEFDELNKEIAMIETRNRIIEKGIKDFAKTGMVGMLSQSKELLVPNFAKIARAMQVSTGIDEENFGAMIEMLGKSLGISEEFIRQMNTLNERVNSVNEDLVSVMKDSGVDMLKDDKKLSKDVLSLVNLASENRDNASSLAQINGKILKVSEGYFKGDEKQASKFAESIIETVKLGPEATGSLIKVIEAINSGDKRDAATIASELGMSKDMVARVVDALNKTKKSQDTNAKDLTMTQEEFIKKTTSAKDYGDIAKASWDYALAKGAAGGTDALLGAVIGIGKNVALIASDKTKAEERRLKRIEGTEIKEAGYRKLPLILESKIKAEKELADLKKGAPSEKSNKKILELEEKVEREKRAIEEAKKQFASGGKYTEGEVEERIGLVGERITKELEPKTKPETKLKPEKIILDAKDVEFQKKLGAIGKEEDFKTTKAGLALLDKGDMAFNPAVGVSGKSGAFLNEILSKMGMFDIPMARGGGQPASYQINLGGIQVNGSIEDPVAVRQAGQQIADMVEQVIVKRERKKMLVTG